MKKLAWWLIAVVILLLSIGAFKESLLGSVLLMVAAALAVPPAWETISAKSGFSYRRTAVAAAAIVGMAVWIGSPGFQKRSAENAKQEALRKASQVETEKAEAAKAEAAKVQTHAQSQEQETAEVADKANPYADETKQVSWILLSKDAIKEKLKDPGSADFKDVRFYSGGGVPVTCGEVNAKNSFGGYNGFEYFIALGDEMAYLQSEVSDFHKLWNKLCVAAPTDSAHTD